MLTKTTEPRLVYRLQEASEQLGVSTGVVRRLCNSGLIPHVRRNRYGHRVLQPWQIDLARLILELKQTGMLPADLRRFARLVREGKASLPAQKALLETRRRQLWQELAACQHGIDVIERQIELIDQELR